MQPDTYRNFRSLLFVPADSASKLTKARTVPADALVLDWEDSVLPENKPLARRLTAEFLRDHRGSRQAILIRLNAVGSDAFQADCEAVVTNSPDGLMLSKCHRPEDIHAAPAGRCPIYPLVESPAGLIRAFEIAGSSDRVAGLALGAEDFTAEMRIIRTAEQTELLYARSALVTASRAAGREAYDSPCLDFRDPEKTKASAQRAHNLGFTGQLAIHPLQIPVLNTVFSPGEAELEQARRLVEASSGNRAAVFVLEGQMVDEAVLRRARRILELARSLESPSDSR